MGIGEFYSDSLMSIYKRLFVFLIAFICFAQSSMADEVVCGPKDWAFREAENVKAHLLRVRQKGKCKWMDDATQRADGFSFKDAVWKIIPQMFSDAKQGKGFFTRDGIAIHSYDDTFYPLYFGETEIVKGFRMQ